MSDTSIHDAVGLNDLEKVKALLKDNPALVSSKNNEGETPLHSAAASGNKDISALLIAYKADVNAKQQYGETPLHFAAHFGYKDVAELLLANKADVNARKATGRTPLHFAATFGHKDVAELLLVNKAKLNAKDKEGETPLHSAVERKHNDVAELLRQQGGKDHQSASTAGDWTLVPLSGIIVGIVMAFSRAHMTGVVWLLPTGLAYAFSITNPNFKFSWLQRGIATVITLLIGTSGVEILSWFSSLYKHP